MYLKMSSGKWRPFCVGLNVLIPWIFYCNSMISKWSSGELRLVFRICSCIWSCCGYRYVNVHPSLWNVKGHSYAINISIRIDHFHKSEKYTCSISHNTPFRTEMCTFNTGILLMANIQIRIVLKLYPNTSLWKLGYITMCKTRYHWGHTPLYRHVSNNKYAWMDCNKCISCLRFQNSLRKYYSQLTCMS